MTVLSRRCVLVAGAALAVPRATPQSGTTDAKRRRMKVVVTGGHPGDPEYGCGGTIARYTELGHEVAILYLNRGEKNCPASAQDPGAAVRVGEAHKACEILKARAIFASQCDGHAVVDNARYEEFRQLLESERPDVVLTHWPLDSHRDHCAISVLVHDAWLRMGKKFAFYYYEVGEDTLMFSPTDYVDISAVESRRRAACYAHASQSPDRFYPEQTQITRFRGLEAGYSQAEAFVRHVKSSGNALP